MANEVQETISREAPEIEERKLGLLDSAKALTDATNLRALQGQYLTPDYQVAGMSPDQLAALQLGRQGIGAYQPYLTAATQGTATGAATLGEAANTLRGADTRSQFGAAQAAMNQAAIPMQQMGQSANLATAGIGLLGQGAQGMGDAQRLALASTSQPGFQQGIGALYGAAGAAQQASRLGAAPAAKAASASAGKVGATPQVNAATVSTQGINAAQSDYDPSLQAFQMGPAQQVQSKSITGAGTLQQYMSPYQQAVTDISLREAQRQDDISRQGRNAAAVRAGAFGGSRQAIMESEAARNLAQLKSDIQTKGLEGAYSSGQQQFNTEQQAALAAQQANQQAGLTVGSQNLAAQQATQQLGAQTGTQVALANLSAQQQANVQSEANRLQAAGMNQEAALRAAMANQQTALSAKTTSAQLQTQAAAQSAQLETQAALANQATQAQYGLAQGQMGLQAAQQLANAGTGQIAATGQEAGLQQNAASMYGNLAGQTAGLAGQYGNIAGQQANILGQQSQLGQSMAQGIGSLAAQQFGIGAQTAQGLGSLGTQQGNLGMQQAALGQQAQAQGQQDSSFLFNTGTAQQKQAQAELDAARQNELQQNMQPYQQVGFLSDIYRGAPTSQMASQQQTSAAPSAFQQAAGLGIAGLGAAGAATRAGVI
jgi:hypothetical protein